MYLLGNNVTIWKDISFLLCIAQNFIILKITRNNHSFDLSFDLKFKDNNNKLYIYEMVLFILKINQILFSFLMLFFFIMKRAPILLHKTREKIQDLDNILKTKNKRTISRFIKILLLFNLLF